jgi:hypothetical protein
VSPSLDFGCASRAIEDGDAGVRLLHAVQANGLRGISGVFEQRELNGPRFFPSPKSKCKPPAPCLVLRSSCRPMSL